MGPGLSTLFPFQILKPAHGVNLVIPEIIHWLNAVPGNEQLRSRPATYFQAHPKVMERVLAEIQSAYGDTVCYVQARGVSASPANPVYELTTNFAYESALASS